MSAEKETIIKLQAQLDFCKNELEEEKEKLSERDNLIGDLYRQLVNEKKYHYVLALRSRIEFLQKLLSKNLLDRIQSKMTREEIWIIILKRSKHSYIADLKYQIEVQGLKEEEFCEAIGILYGDASDRAAHNIPMPKSMKKDEIEKVAELLDVPDDETFVKTVEILRTKLKSNVNYTNEKFKASGESDGKTELNKSSSSSDSVVSFKSKNDSSS